MAATEIANAYIALYTKMPGVEKDIKESLGGADSAYESAGAKGGSKFSSAAALAIISGAVVVAAAVATVTAKAVMAFGELEQNVGGAEAVFGQYAATVQQKGVDAYKNLGLSQSEYLATANKMGALFQGSGIEQARAVDLTTEAMQRAADMASVMGIEQSMAMESVAGAAKGNFTMMDNLGVAMNATSIEAYAASKGVTDWSFATADAASRAEMAMAMFMESTSQYAGNFARESGETVTGSIGMMGAAWDSLMAGLGDKNADVSQLTANLVEAFKTVVANIAPVVGEIFASLPEVFSGLFEGTDLGIVGDLVMALSPAMMIFEAIKPLLPEISALFMQLVTAIAPLAEQLSAALVPIISQLAAALFPIIQAILPIVMQLFNALVPIVIMLVEAFVPLLEPILSLITPLLDLITSVLPPLVDLFMILLSTVLPPLQTVIAGLIPIVTGVVNALVGMLTPAINMITNVLTGIINFIVGVFTGNWQRAWDGIVQIFSGIWEGVKGIVEGALNGVIDIINGVIGGINSMAGAVSTISGGAINLSIGKIPKLAEGGIVQAQRGGILANIGEGRYDEAVIPLSPAVLSGLGGGKTVEMNNTFYVQEQDERVLMRKVGRELKASLS